jgi:hypothetical protein
METDSVIRSPIVLCRHCGTSFLAVSWIGYRVAGYCTEKCQPAAEVNQIDVDVVQSAHNYVVYGLEPGSCCMQMLLGDLEGAARACHPNALKALPNTYQAVRDLVPAEARDSVIAIRSWIAHNGLAGA